MMNILYVSVEQWRNILAESPWLFIKCTSTPMAILGKKQQQLSSITILILVVLDNKVLKTEAVNYSY